MKTRDVPRMSERPETEDDGEVGPDYTEIVTIRLSPKQLVATKKRAKPLGVTAGTYYRMRIIDDVNWEDEPEPSSEELRRWKKRSKEK